MIIKSIIRILVSSLVGFSLLLLIACEGGSPDSLKEPEIAVIDVYPEVATLEICGEDDPFSIALSSGDSLFLTFNLRAVNGLSAYNIDVHGNFDCHSHGRISQSTPWKILLTEAVVGKDITITEEFAVPWDVQAGNYHFMMQALDLLGNKAEPLLYSLKINNIGDTEPAQIQLISPNSDIISIMRNDPIEVILTVTDNKSLYGGRVDVTYSDSSGTEFTAEQHFFSEEDGSEVTYNFSFGLPASAPSGDYLFLFTVYDAVGNTSDSELSVLLEN